MRLRLLLIVLGVIFSALLCAGASALTAKHYHELALREFRAALQQMKTGEVDRGKLESCISVMNNSCTMQWGTPCVAKKPGKAKWE